MLASRGLFACRALVQTTTKCTNSAASAVSFNIRHFSKERAGKSVRPGVNIILDNQPHRCTKFIQGKRGKGGGFVKATLKNIITGNTFEKTFTSDEMVEFADLERRGVTYSWSDDINYIFMDLETYEEVVIPMSMVDDGHYLIPGLEVKVQYFREGVIGVELPLIVTYKVATRPVDGSKQSGDLQPATLEGCSAVVMVPDFVKEGTGIRVNTIEGTYLDKV